jgi:hypothetical protein
MTKKIKSPKMKRRLTLLAIKKDIKSIGEFVDLLPVEKGERKFRREIRSLLAPLKQNGKLENFRVSTSTSGGNLFAELFLKFPKIDDATLIELRILRK